MKIKVKTILKWILVTAAVLIVVLIVTGYAILSSYGYNDLKPQITKAVLNATGRELTIGGDIKIKLGLIPALVLTDIKFQNARWGTRKDLAKIKYFEVQVALLPLLKRKIEVKRLILVEPEIIIETNKHGKSNLVFAAPQEPIPPPEEETTLAENIAPLLALIFNKVQIKKGLFVYRDGKSGKTYKVKLKLLTAGAASIDGPVKISIKGDYHNQPFDVTGTIGPLATLLNSDKAWSLNLIAKALDATATLDGSVKDIKTPRGIDLGFRIKARDLTKLSQFAGKTLPRNEPFEMAFRVTDIGPKAYRLSDFKARLGRNNISGSIDINSDKVWSLNLIAKAFDATVKLNGSVKDIKTPRGIDLGFRIKARNLTKLSQLAGKTLPFNQALEMAFRATDIGFKAYRLSDFKARLGRNDLSGSIDVNFVKKTPLLKATLWSKKIDLRPYLSAHKKNKSKKVFPDDPLLLDALNHAEGTVKIHANRFLLPRLALKHLTAKITLKRGSLTISSIKAAIGGGKLNGRLTIKPRGKTVAVTTQLKVEDCNLGNMLKELNITDALEGNLNVNINLKGKGRSVATLMADLDGSASIQISQARINNKYINLLGDDLGTSLFHMLYAKKGKAGHTRINCLVSGFDIKKGLAVSTATVFDTSSRHVFGEGEINLKTEEIDFSLHPIPKGGLGFSGIGKLSLSLGELAEPFKIGGTLAEPSLTLDPAGTATTLGKAIGGFLLFGPFGIAAALISTSSGDETPCLTAIEAINKATAAKKNKKTAMKKTAMKKTAMKKTSMKKTSMKKIAKKKTVKKKTEL